MIDIAGVLSVTRCGPARGTGATDAIYEWKNTIIRKTYKNTIYLLSSEKHSILHDLFLDTGLFLKKRPGELVYFNRTRHTSQCKYVCIFRTYKLNIISKCKHCVERVERHICIALFTLFKKLRQIFLKFNFC